jgi:hypothetical protein
MKTQGKQSHADVQEYVLSCTKDHPAGDWKSLWSKPPVFPMLVEPLVKMSGKLPS